jgi:hypothetical protein
VTRPGRGTGTASANQVGRCGARTATKDWANCVAKADVKVDGTVLLEGVPATYLPGTRAGVAQLAEAAVAATDSSSRSSFSIAVDCQIEWTPTETVGCRFESGLPLQRAAVV